MAHSLKFSVVDTPYSCKNDIRYLVFCSIAYQSLGLGECNITRRRPVALIICDYLYFAVLEDANAGIRRSKVDADCWSFGHVIH